MIKRCCLKNDQFCALSLRNRTQWACWPVNYRSHDGLRIVVRRRWEHYNCFLFNNKCYVIAVDELNMLNQSNWSRKIDNNESSHYCTADHLINYLIVQVRAYRSEVLRKNYVRLSKWDSYCMLWSRYSMQIHLFSYIATYISWGSQILQPNKLCRYSIQASHMYFLNSHEVLQWNLPSKPT